jgi:hypothetical protein
MHMVRVPPWSRNCLSGRSCLSNNPWAENTPHCQDVSAIDTEADSISFTLVLVVVALTSMVVMRNTTFPDQKQTRSSRRGLAWFLCLLPAFLLLALSPGTSEAEDLSPTVSVEGQYTGRGDLRGDRGSVSSSTGKVVASMLPFTLEYDVSQYSWRGTNRLPFGDKQHKPWDTLHLLSFSFDYETKISGNFGVFAEAVAFAGYEEELTGSLGANLTGGLSYEMQPGLKLNVGVSGLFHEVHSRPLPIIRLDWNQNATQGFSASLGFPENTLAYRFNKAYALRFAQTFDDTIYRLADDSSLGHKSYLESVGVVSGLYLDYSPLPGFTGTIGAQYVLHRKFNMYDPDGNKRDTFSLDNALGGVLRLEYKF